MTGAGFRWTDFLRNQLVNKVVLETDHFKWKITKTTLITDYESDTCRLSYTLCTSKFGSCATTHYNDVTMKAIASQMTSLAIVYSTVYSDADQRKHQSSASLAFVRGIHRWPVNSPHKWPVTRKTFPFDDVVMKCFERSKTCRNKILPAPSKVKPSNGSWRQGIKGEMPCTVYVALVWNIIYLIYIWMPLFVITLWPNPTIFCHAR